MITAELVYMLGIALTLLLSVLGCGIGLGIAGYGIAEHMSRQPAGIPPSAKAAFIGLALIESSAIIALVTALALLNAMPDGLSLEVAMASAGAALAVGCAAMVVSIASSKVVAATAQSIARQPLFAPKLITFMAVAQSIIEAPVIFAFIVNLMVRGQISPTMDLAVSLKLLAACLVIAVGCIGPSIGQALCASSASQALGLNSDIYNRLFTFTLINQVMIETPMIFSLIVALVTILMPLSAADPFSSVIQSFSAAGAMGLGALGSSIGLGMVASKSFIQVALEPTCYSVMVRPTILCAALIESSAIYALIIALMLLSQ